MKKYTSYITSTLIALFLSVGLGVAFAFVSPNAFSIPSGVPAYNSNAQPAVNEGNNDQTKSGTLFPDSLLVTGQSVFLNNKVVMGTTSGAQNFKVVLNNQKSPTAAGSRLCVDTTGKVLICPAPGLCDPASDGKSFYASQFPGTHNLCSAGTASAVSGTGPWTWSCAGMGAPDQCSASLTNFTASDQYFYTLGNHTVTVPTGASAMIVELWGAGSQGGNSTGNGTTYNTGAGGGAGAYLKVQKVNPVAGTTYSITIPSDSSGTYTGDTIVSGGGAVATAASNTSTIRAGAANNSYATSGFSILASTPGAAGSSNQTSSWNGGTGYVYGGTSANASNCVGYSSSSYSVNGGPGYGGTAGSLAGGVAYTGSGGTQTLDQGHPGDRGCVHIRFQ